LLAKVVFCRLEGLLLAALAILPAMFSDDDPESSGEDPDPVDEPSLGDDLQTGTYQADEVSA
jgi:hypothetical protein